MTNVEKAKKTPAISPEPSMPRRAFQKRRVSMGKGPSLVASEHRHPEEA
jgi:hypothetical protein